MEAKVILHYNPDSDHGKLAVEILDKENIEYEKDETLQSETPYVEYTDGSHPWEGLSAIRDFINFYGNDHKKET